MDRCPYKGLLPYTEDDAPYFFGRDTERRVIGDNLRASRLTLLYGESGAGKSSVLRAGVAYDLRNDPDYAIVVFPRIQKGEAVDSWRNDPVAGISRAIHESLGSALTRRLKPQFVPPPPEPKPVIIGNTMILPPREPSRLEELLRPAGGGDASAEEPPDLGGLLEEYADATGRNLLIVLDQFEEYFQYHPHEAGPGTLAEELPQLVNRHDFPVNFLISIRQDAVASLDRFKNQIPNLFSNYLRIGFLSPEAAQVTILKPLGKYNEEVVIGQRTLAAIRGDLRGGEPVSPDWTLQVALLARTDPIDSEVLEQARALFGDGMPVKDIPHVPLAMTDAVAAEVVQEIIRAQGDDRQQVQAAYLQLVMTRWWEKEVAARSGEMRRQTLNELGGVKKIVDEHLEKTIKGLGAWRQDDVAKILAPMVTSAGRKIAQTVTELVGSTDLPKDAVGDILEKLLKARILATVPPPRGSLPEEKCYEFAHDVVAKAALEWLGKRRQAQKAEAAEHEAAQARLRAEGERKRAEVQAQQVIKFRRIAWALGAVLLIAVATAVFAFVQRKNAREVKTAATIQGLVASSIASLQDDPERGVLLAMHAVQLTRSLGGAALPAAEDELHRAVVSSHVRLTLSGHRDKVRCVAWSPDGKRLATGSWDKTAKVWDAATGKELLTLSGHARSVPSVAWSPDGRRLATGSEDTTAKVWDAATGKELLSFSGHAATVYSVAWSPDGKRLATGSADNTVKVWEAATGNELLSLSGQGGNVYSVTWSPDGKRLATGSGDGTAKVWDAATRKELLRFAGHHVPVLSVAWSPDGKRLAMGSADGVTKLWDVATRKELLNLAGHRGAVSSVA